MTRLERQNALTHDERKIWRSSVRQRATTQGATPNDTTFSYQAIVADPKAKVDKTTGLLIGGVNLGTISFTETSIKGKTYFDSSFISFNDLVRIGDLTTLKNVQIQLLVTYTASDSTPAVATKVAKITLPKRFA